MILVGYKKYFYLLIFLFLVGIGLEAKEWKEVKGDHFIVYFISDKNENFSKEVLRKAEKYYKRIADELGYPRYSNFWTWDKRVKIYIHPTHASFIKATQQPKWSKGVAEYTKKVIVSYRWQNEKNFLNFLLPHELGHLIFRDFIGFKGEVPLWLDEGVAQWQEKAKRKIVKRKIKELLKKNRLFSLKKLTSIDNAKLYQGMHKQRVHEFYIESVSLVDFLITRYGTNSFTKFCRQLRDGKSLNEALKFSYPPSIRSIDKLEKEWMEYINK